MSVGYQDLDELSHKPSVCRLSVVLGLQIISVGLIGEIITFSYAKDLKDYKVERLVE